MDGVGEIDRFDREMSERDAYMHEACMEEVGKIAKSSAVVRVDSIALLVEINAKNCHAMKRTNGCMLMACSRAE